MQRRALVAAMLVAVGGGAVQAKRQPAQCDSSEAGRATPALRAAARAAAAALGGYAAWAISKRRQAAAETEERVSAWKDRWGKGHIHFHIEEVHPQLIAHGARMLDDGVSAPYFPKRILVTLCGKAVDMPFLASRGHTVVGVDAVQLAMEQLAEKHASGPIKTTSVGRFQVTDIPVKGAQNAAVKFVVGDFFEMDKKVAGTFEACWDRGGLVAIEPRMREAYVETLSGLLDRGARILLVTTEHDPFSGGKLGPPFHVSEEEVRRLFAKGYSVELLQREDRLPKEPEWTKRGSTYFNEATYLITKR